MAIDKKDLKDFILKPARESLEANKQRHKYLDEYTKRFEALRSVASLDDDIKRKPWLGCANVGIPLDATVVYTLQARLIKATWGVSPPVSVRPNDFKFCDPIQRMINWEMWEEMRLFMDLMLGYQGMLVDGDCIFKTVIDKDEVYFDDEQILFLNEDGEAYESTETGAPLEAEHEDQPSIFDPLTLKEYKPKRVDKQDKRTVYYGPKVIKIPTKHFLVPQDADNIDPSKLDWNIHEFWRPYGWIKQKSEQNPDLFDKDEVRAMRKSKDQTRAMEEDSKMKVLGLDLKTKTKNFKFWEWHGRYEDDKGNQHELIALLSGEGKEPSRLLGYVPNRFYFRRGRRQFVHYTGYPQDGKFWGKGAPEMLRGIRSMVDALVNTDLDRSALFNNPPLLHDLKLSGFDPSEHKFGPGKTWGLNRITPDMIRALELPTNPSSSMIREEMLFEIVQKLFGVTDYALGSQGRKSGVGAAQASKTASGIASIINEGNIRFDVLIKLVQEEANPELATQIWGHWVMNRYSIMKEKGLNNPRDIFDPVMQMSEDELNTNFQYVFKGNTSTINPVVKKEEISYLYDKFTATKNPFVVDDEDVTHEFTEMMLEGTGIKIKSPDELKAYLQKTQGKGGKQAQEQGIQKALGLKQPGNGQLAGVQ